MKKLILLILISVVLAGCGDAYRQGYSHGYEKGKAEGKNAGLAIAHDRITELDTKVNKFIEECKQ